MQAVHQAITMPQTSNNIPRTSKGLSDPMKCAILDDYQQIAAKYFDLSGYPSPVNTIQEDFFHLPIGDHDQLVATLEPYDIIVAMRERTPFPAALLGQLPNLKLLVTSGMRNLAIDTAFARTKGIAVCGTRGFKEPPTELAWALILGLARRIREENTAFRIGGPWQSTLGVTLHGKTLSLLGLGKIGQKMAKIGQAFGMKVTAWSQNLTEERCAEHGVEFAPSLEALLRQGDFVSIHVVLSDRTRQLMGANELGMMKPSAYLINTSRAAIVNQDDLLDALRNKTIAGAGLDVFDEEPLPLDHPYRSLDNLLATPHIGYVADMNYEAYFAEAAENIVSFCEGKLIRELQI